VDQATVGKWRRRFAEKRLDGLYDEPRSGAPRSIDDARVEAVIVKTLESAPANATHWSSRGMAKACGLSVSTVQRIWRAFGLQPHRIESFKLSTDPDFVAKVRDVVGPYMAPPERAIVLCVDEKSQIQALDRSQPMPMRPGQPARRSHDYQHHGTTRCSPPWTSPPAPSSANAMPVIAPASSANSSTRSKQPSPAASTFISSWTITPPTRRR
jgi:hypothetical protein